MTLSRRLFLGAACSAAASPLMTPVTLAAAPGESRLVVILLRGAMDGLSVVRPVFDPSFAALRPDETDGPDLGAGWRLHPELAPLAGEVAAVHAVSTPYGSGRSHFDGQDVLETGALVGGASGGWLGRLAGLMPDSELRTVFAVGAAAPLIVRGPAPVAVWDPGLDLALPEQTRRLFSLVQGTDALFSGAAERALDLAAREREAEGVDAAAYAAEQLRADTRIATFSIGGWDTHAGQARTLRRPLRQLVAAVEALRTGLGPLWDRTAVLALTEFGRTARMNGTRGTDHGTGGAMLMMGGAVRAGEVHGQWPGLAEEMLLERRDLRPTADLRAPVAGVIEAMFPVARADLTGTVFPGLGEVSGAGLLR